jgi:hypothetical protein
MDDSQKERTERPLGLLDKIRKLSPDETLNVTPEECAEAIRELFRWVEELEEDEGSKA